MYKYYHVNTITYAYQTEVPYNYKHDKS